MVRAGNTGQRSLAASQTVTTQSQGSATKRSSVFEAWPAMSTPASAIARIASGCTRVASVPALAASKRSPARARSQPSAIWLRAELCVQRKSTRRRAVMAARRGA